MSVVHVLLQHGAEPNWSDPGLNVEDFVSETRRLFWDRVLHSVSVLVDQACVCL